MSSKKIPDTLILEKRAEIALNNLMGYVNEDNKSLPYMFGILAKDPAYLCHSCWDYGSSVGRLVSSIVLARQMTGNQMDKDIEAKLRKNLIDFFEEDGLNYRWESPYNEANANMHDQRSVLLGLITWYMESGDEEVKRHIDDLVSALKKIAIKEKDFWFFPSIEYTHDGWPSAETVNMLIAPDPAHTSGRMINPLIKWYQLTDNREALELAEYFTRHTVHHSGAFNKDGSFNDGGEFRHGHFHSRMITVAGIARFAKITDDFFYMNWVKKVYDWVLSMGTSFGWFPGGMKKNKAYHHETCTLTDIIETGIILAQFGFTKHWDNVERFVRNHLVEAQILDHDWINETDDPSNNTKWKTYSDVGKRSVGGFAGWAAPNDFVNENVSEDDGHEYDLMTCCSAAGTRALFLAWSNIVTEKNGRVYVNLLLNKTSDLLDVKSYLPHEGKVVLELNQDIKELMFRIPDWVNFSEVRLNKSQNDFIKPEQWVDNFIKIFNVKQGDTITVTFPVRKNKTKEIAWDKEYMVKWQADEVVSISPEGKYYPLYNHRQVYDKAPLTEREYLNIEQKIYW